MDVDDFYDLLDYDEEDLNGDLHRVSDTTNCESNDYQAAQEVVNEYNGDLHHPAKDLRLKLKSKDKIEVEFFYSNPDNMCCPIDGCNGGNFCSKAKYMRHWKEKHVETCIKYICSMNGCNVSVRRRYDMKVHMTEVHKFKDKARIERWVNMCEKPVMENRGYIDPGFWVFKGRTTSATSTTFSTISTIASPSLAPTSVSTSSIGVSPTVSSSNLPVSTLSPFSGSASVPAPSSTVKSSSSAISCVTTVPDVKTVISTALSSPDDNLPSDSTQFSVVVPPKPPVGLSSSSGQKISLLDYRLRETHALASSDVRQVSDFSTSFGIKATSDESCQTSSLDYSTLRIPPIPVVQEELEAYIRWLCLSMDQLGRQREAAKEKLVEMRKEGGHLEKERQLRRALEAENRRLKRELSEAKWREKYVFPEL